MIKLARFDRKFSLSIDSEKILFDRGGIYYTIQDGDKKVGFVGYVPAKFPLNSGFVQITIVHEHRGKGILLQAENLLAEKHGLRTLYATIKLENFGSIKAHKKAGFEMVDENEIDRLRRIGSLKDGHIRMVKVL